MYITTLAVQPHTDVTFAVYMVFCDTTKRGARGDWRYVTHARTYRAHSLSEINTTNDDRSTGSWICSAFDPQLQLFPTAHAYVA